MFLEVGMCNFHKILSRLCRSAKIIFAIIISLNLITLIATAEDDYEIYKISDSKPKTDGEINEYKGIDKIRIDDYSQVIQNSFNYRDKTDLSCKLGIALYGENLLVFGEVLDDISLCQTRENPINPNWWKITYGADGIGLLFSSSQKEETINKIILNFGSQGLKPVIVLDKIPNKKSGTSSGELAVKKTRTGYTFEAQIPISELSNGLFNSDFFFDVLIYDMDGDESTYKVMALKSKLDADLQNPSKWMKAIIKKNP